MEAAERGVHMRILVPGSHIDKQFVRTAGRAAYDELIDAGIEIYEYCPTMLHAKTLTVDEIWSSVGSVNFDNRSFQLHDEVTLCVQSERRRPAARGVRGTSRRPSGSSPTSGGAPDHAAGSRERDEVRTARALAVLGRVAATDLGGPVGRKSAQVDPLFADVPDEELRRSPASPRR